MDTPINTAITTVDVALDAELLRETQRHTMNVSRLIERLLREYLEAERIAEPQRRADAEAHCRVTNALIEKHGFWGEEFSTL